MHLSEGEEIDGWKLVRVDPQQAEFDFNGRRLVLEIESLSEPGGAPVEWQRVD